METMMGMVWLGVGATLATDAWAWLRRRVFGVPMPDYRLVGRWFGHMPRGVFRHAAIGAAAPVRGERLIGWAAHYLIGIGFAGLLLAGWGPGWLRQPKLAPALIVGLATVAAPFFVMQPAFGAGVAASRTPRPARARLHSLAMHAVFGLGLYGAGLVIKALGLP